MGGLKKLVGILLALVMVLSLCVPALAEEEGETVSTVHAQEGTLTGGSITIDNAVEDQTYRLYQLLYLESYDPGANAYAYKANSAWEAWLKTQTTYVSFDDQGYVTWVEDADAAAFAKAALAHAKEDNILPVVTQKAKKDENEKVSVSFTGLKLGYYLVDSTLGTLCSLDTTNPSVTMKEKNAAPTNVKEVQEDSDGTWGEENDADIGDTVYFHSTITVQAGAENYVFHDVMSAGLTYKEVSGITLNGETVTNDENQNYTVVTGEDITDGCTFEVVFTQAFLDELKADDEIVISYSAVLNEKAEIAGAGNDNKSYLTYGEAGTEDYNKTPESKTTTYTWEVKVFKYTPNGDDQKPMAGAKFTLSKNANGSEPIALVKVGDNVYRVATEEDTDTLTEITTDNSGTFTIQGLDSDTYYLTETQPPAGYNALSEAIKIVIDDEGRVNPKDDEGKTVGVERIEVENQTGAELPSTGGVGTTIFYVVGGILVAAAIVLLITKRRMATSKSEK